MHTVCFVTNEIYPLHKGGIGRLLYNIACENRKSATPVHMHYLMVWQPEHIQREIRQAFEGLADIHFCPLSGSSHGGWIAEYERSNELRWHYGHAYRQSLMLYAALRQFEENLGYRFDFIEFPDYGGWALATLEAKAAGLAFTAACIAVRLHSTGGVVAAHQPFYEKAGHWNGCIEDMEYLSLQKADLVIGHLPKVADFNQQYYGFSDAWRAAVHMELPPIILTPEEMLTAEEGAVCNDSAGYNDRDFIFSSRLQPFKQPDLFIKAALYFLQETPAYQGRFRLISYGWDENYVQWLRNLIPAHRRDRVIIETGVSSADRLRAITQGIVVIPSNYESLCLFAVEASALSGTLILNGDCLAFQEEALWQDEVNCLLFEGGARGLARVMQKALKVELPEKVRYASTRPYWQQAMSPCNAGPVDTTSLPSALSILVHGFKAPSDVPPYSSKLADFRAAGYLPTIILPEAWRDQVTPPAGAAVYWCTGSAPWPDDFAHLVGSMTGLVAIWPYTVTVAPDYLERAVGALRDDPELAAYGAHATLHQDDRRAVRVYSGGAPAAALLSSEVLPPGAVFRVGVLQERIKAGCAFCSSEKDNWYEVLARGMALDGARMVIEPSTPISMEAGNLREKGEPAIDNAVFERHIRQAGSRRPRYLPGLMLKPLPPIPIGAPKMDLSHALRGAEQALPKTSSPDWQPVAYRMKERAVQVHPMTDTRVVATLPISDADVFDKLSVRLRHYGDGNPGVDFRLFCGAGPDWETAVSRCDWQTIIPGETRELTLSGLEGARFGRVFIEARPTDGVDVSYAWTFADRLWTH